jgi:hypothetical protein
MGARPRPARDSSRNLCGGPRHPFDGAFLGISGAAIALEAHGLWLVLGTAILGILAAVKTIESRYRSLTVQLIANNAQSLWGQSRGEAVPRSRGVLGAGRTSAVGKGAPRIYY